MRDGFVRTGDGCRLFYQIDGLEHDAPTIVFAHALGTTHALWDAQAAAFSASYRVLRYDGRGHGRSDVPAGPYSIDRLAADVIDLLDGTQTGTAIVCGVSLGGMVAMRLGSHHRSRIAHLVLANTAAVMGPPQNWNERIRVAREAGMAALRAAILERWFTAEFALAQPAEVARVGALLDATEPAGYAANCAAIRDMDQREALATIDIPTLVIVGERDPATPPADGEDIAARIPGARLVALRAAHLSNIERAVEFNAAVRTALAADPPAAGSAYFSPASSV